MRQFGIWLRKLLNHKPDVKKHMWVKSINVKYYGNESNITQIYVCQNLTQSFHAIEHI